VPSLAPEQQQGKAGVPDNSSSSWPFTEPFGGDITDPDEPHPQATGGGVLNHSLPFFDPDTPMDIESSISIGRPVLSPHEPYTEPWGGRETNPNGTAKAPWPVFKDAPFVEVKANRTPHEPWTEPWGGKETNPNGTAKAPWPLFESDKPLFNTSGGRLVDAFANYSHRNRRLDNHSEPPYTKPFSPTGEPPAVGEQGVAPVFKSYAEMGHSWQAWVGLAALVLLVGGGVLMACLSSYWNYMKGLAV